PYEISGYQGDIVDYLRSEGIAATFFASGKWFLTHSERAQQIMADPVFEFGNHAWEHRNFRLLSNRRAQAEINGAQLAYEQTYRRLRQRNCRAPSLAGAAHTHAAKQMTLFRFPYGACKKEALDWVNNAGLLAIQWDVSSGDPWKGQTVAGMVNGVVSRAKSGSIVIFHANGRGWKTGEALPHIIRRLRARGFSFATVSDLLNTKGAVPVTSKSCYDARPGDADRYDNLARKLEQRYQAFYAQFAKPRTKGATR
ncbi:MAG: polysaccharide deacetylase family protein, partial [Pseudomonadota bacterium]